MNVTGFCRFCLQPHYSHFPSPVHFFSRLHVCALSKEEMLNCIFHKNKGKYGGKNAIEREMKQIDDYTSVLALFVASFSL